MLQQPEDRLGDEPEDAVVDGQLEARREFLEVLLDLRTGVQGGAGFRLGAGGDAEARAGEADDVVALAVLAGLQDVVVALGGNPGGDEVVLQPGDPAALHGFLEALLVHVLHRHFLVGLGRRPQRGAEVGGGAGGGGRRRVIAVVALELGEQVAAPRLATLVVDLVADAELVLAAGEDEALDVVDAAFAVGEFDTQLVLAVGQLVFRLGAAPQRAAAGLVRRIAADQAALRQVGALATVIEQLERHVRTILATRVLRQGQLDDVAAARVDGQVEDVGAHVDQLIADGRSGQGRRLGAVSLGSRHVLIGDGTGGRGIRQRRCSGRSGNFGFWQGGLSVVLVPLKDHQVGHDCQGDDQDRAFDIHDYSAIEVGRVGETGGTGS
ncbi:hypothetical protein D9M70_385430 [compost metagenome]